ncbi:MAG: hypothetical protein OEW75_02240 [Cyclobacteriaceae bacterium]|nr:hypothetical protein [Cyclobacteriaceae bacterium]
MKKLLYAFLLPGLIATSGCNSLKQMTNLADEQDLQVSPNPLEVHADTVTFDMSVNLPVKMLKKENVYTVNTFYKYGQQEVTLEPIEFRATDYPNASTEQPRQSKSFSFAYTDAMSQPGSLEVQGVATNPAKPDKVEETPRMPVAPGIITTSKLAQPAFYAVYADHGYNNQEELVPTRIDFFFDQGRSALKSSEKRSERGKEFEGFIADKNVTKTVSITGTHSPEGTETINSNLSEDRAAVIEKYYRAQMKRYDYKGMADSINFILKPVIQDWNDFKNALAEYEGITSEEKSEYLNIINGGGAFIDTEKQLKSLPTYKKVFNEVYPGLRSAKTEILTVKEKKTDAEISVLAKQITQNQASADTLSEQELMYAATLTPSLEEKAAIYEAATKKSGSWNAHNNLGAVYIAMAIENPSTASSNGSKAKAQLDIAANKNASAGQVHANLASVYLLQGNYVKANSELNQASGLSSDDNQGVNGVKGAVQIMLADYAGAVRSESSASETAVNSFNKGLAQLLNKDYQNAINSFNEATSQDENFALAYYAAAVAQARANNLQGVVDSLKTAVGKDPELKSKALNDLEFRNYVANELFTAALR